MKQLKQLQLALVFALMMVLVFAPVIGAEEKEHATKEQVATEGHKTEGHAKEEHKGAAPHAHWTYEGAEGPEHWGDLSPTYATCKIGKSQSPIDIPKVEAATETAIAFSYAQTPLKIINNGHTIQVNYSPNSTITINGKEYKLMQFHFHSPSEHTLMGESFPMEAHIVHATKDKELAVIGVLFKVGAENPFIKTLWEHLPQKVDKEETVKGVNINAKQLIPTNTATYYNYSGSLTTPPCSENVNWNVLQTPIEVSQEQVDKFVSLIGKNARPVQPINERDVKSINKK
ncbi:MAG: carbonic anhydrase family protein [Candidatus Magnetoovum sp. WYHC-5]|nr:carbonic anhydrase family protein [Candidatus Magnetoovum sp. WYHC-5]UOH28350.1 carbonic anhydrase [Candidatus Magnetoovum sp.]